MKGNAGAETLHDFLALHAGNSRLLEAYVRLSSDLSLAAVASALSSATGLSLQPAEGYDECEAYAAEIGDHELTVLLPPLGAGPRLFEIMIEPGPYCSESGDMLNLSGKLTEWLHERAPQLGEFEAMG